MVSTSVVLLPTGCVDEDGIIAQLINDTTVELSLKWQSVLLDRNTLTNGMVKICPDLDLGNATLLTQGLMWYMGRFQNKGGDDITSKCRIDLPFAVKSDFSEDVLQFRNSSAILYLLRFCAPDCGFTPKSARLRIHTIDDANPNCADMVTPLKLRIRYFH